MGHSRTNKALFWRQPDPVASPGLSPLSTSCLQDEARPPRGLVTSLTTLMSTPSNPPVGKEAAILYVGPARVNAFARLPPWISIGA